MEIASPPTNSVEQPSESKTNELTVFPPSEQMPVHRKKQETQIAKAVTELQDKHLKKLLSNPKGSLKQFLKSKKNL